MKNGTELPLIGLVIIAALAVLFAIWNSMQVDLAAAQVNATVAQGQMPMAELVSGQISGWIVKAVIGVLAIGAATALVTWVQSLLQKRSAGAWQAGPNARWQREPRPRTVSEGELMRMVLLQQMTGRGNAPVQQPPMIHTEGDDEAQIYL